MRDLSAVSSKDMTVTPEPDGNISKESSFYGDDDTRQDLAERSSACNNLASYWSTHGSRPSVLALKSIKQQTFQNTSESMFNAYEGYATGRQLSETVPEFLSRLPPFQTKLADLGPWIFISNPTYCHIVTSEDIQGLKEGGAELLRAFNNAKADIESRLATKPQAVVSRNVNIARKQLERDILTLAREKGVISGKWMLFPPPQDVNRVWSLVAQATADGELGQAAKVATDDGSGDKGARLICAYNEDYADQAGVRKSLEGLVRMGLVGGHEPVKMDRGIYYKADAFTYLDIFSGNQWGLKPSMYSSKEILRNAKRDQDS